MNAMILPPVDRSFAWRQTAAGAMLSAVDWPRQGRHFFTTRAWELGHGPARRDDEAAWLQVAEAAGVAMDQLVRMRQVHGAEIIEARGGVPPQAADIVVSDDPSLALVAQAADCIPLLLFDGRSGAAAAAHAGWRGLAQRVPEVAVAALVDRFGASRDNLVAAAGPSIGACCYEVGADVVDAFRAAGFAETVLERWFHTRPVTDPANPRLPSVGEAGAPGKRFFDGWKAVAEQLEVSGLRREHILVARSCTASHPAAYCSFRREGVAAGRLLGVIRPGRAPVPD